MDEERFVKMLEGSLRHAKRERVTRVVVCENSNLRDFIGLQLLFTCCLLATYAANQTVTQCSVIFPERYRRLFCDWRRLPTRDTMDR